jgi:hypothetical protein
MLTASKKSKQMNGEMVQNELRGASQAAPPPGLQPILLIKQLILL